jgi:hypothetical protein
MKNIMYRIFIYYENNKILKLETYNSFVELLLDDKYSTIDILINSFQISEELYKKLIFLQRENFYFFKNYSVSEFIKKFGLEEVII